MSRFEEILSELETLDLSRLYQADLFLSWDRGDQEIAGMLAVSDALRELRGRNISPRLFDSGLGLALGREGEGQTRAAFAAACSLLGLTPQRREEAPGEPLLPECLLADLVGLTDRRPGGHGRMAAAADDVERLARDAALDGRPTLINLGCEQDQPTRVLADALHLIHHFGGVEGLRGKKAALAWVYAPEPGLPPALPQGTLGLLTRFGMDVTLAHPEGYDLPPEARARAEAGLSRAGGSLKTADRLEAAFEGADVVYPMYWDSPAAQTRLGAAEGPEEREEARRESREENSRHEDWSCTGALMARTRAGRALCLHSPAAYVTGVNCRRGEVEDEVFRYFQGELCRQAAFEPYLIAAVVLLSQCKAPVDMLRALERRDRRRKKT